MVKLGAAGSTGQGARSLGHGAWSMEHGAWSTGSMEHGAWSTELGAGSTELGARGLGQGEPDSARMSSPIENPTILRNSGSLSFWRSFSKKNSRRFSSFSKVVPRHLTGPSSTINSSSKSPGACFAEDNLFFEQLFLFAAAF